MTKKQKKMLKRIILSAVGLIAVALLDHFGPTVWLPGPIPFLSVSHISAAGGAAWSLALWPLYLIPYFIIGWDILWKAVRNIGHGQVFDESFLMAIATVGALLIQEYPEAVFVMLFYHIGELFEWVAVG